MQQLLQKLWLVTFNKAKGAHVSYVFKYLLLMFLTCSILLANDAYVEKQQLNLSYVSLSEQYCKNTKENNTLCLEKRLRYLDYTDVSIPKYLRKSKKYIQHLLRSYHSNNIKKFVQSSLLDVKENKPSGEWYNDLNIDLFAKTSQTYTLSIQEHGYTGGAHGHHIVKFENYTIKTQKRIILDDLFLPGYFRELHHIAQKHYKHIYGLKQEQSLELDGWFQDKFQLAENFAITPKGLLFIYNAYEIKPYSAGHTQLILPYTKLQTILDPQGIAKFSIQNSH